jgi:hypothetical protein
MKTCSKCGISKNESDFFVKDKKTNRLHAQCKQCYKAHRQTYYAQHYQTYKEEYLLRAQKHRESLRHDFRSNLAAYLSGKACEVCGETDIRVLEFDHLNPESKLFNISQAVRLGYSWDAVVIEISKCRILCANCHRKHTAAQFGWYKAE